MQNENDILTQEHIEEYAAHLREQERAENTVQKYRSDLAALRRWLGGRPLAKLVLIQWKEHLALTYAATSVNSMLAALNGLLQFMGRGEMAVKPLRIQKRLFCDEGRELTKKEYVRLVETARGEGNERLALVLQTLCATGIRVSELPYITAKAVRLGRAEISNKGKLRTVFLPDKLRRLLKRYMLKAGCTEGAVFVTRTGKPLDRSNIWRDMKRLCKSAGVEPDYCWFSEKPMPLFLQECVQSWRELCPDYEIKEWNEKNYDVADIPYVEEAYKNGSYGFVADVARLDILYQYGGVYLDTDVTLLKSLDELLYQPAFVGVEKWGNINTGGGCGAVAHHPMIREMLEYRKCFHFLQKDGSRDTATNGLYETIPFLRHGMKVDNTMQIINGVTIYPSCVFHPYDYMSCEDSRTEATIAKHHFYGGWMDKQELHDRQDTQRMYRSILKRMKCGTDIA